MLGLELPSLGVGDFESPGEFLAEEFFKSLAQVVVERDGAVVVGDTVFDFVDQDHFALAGGGLRVPASAHEVLVLVAVPCGGDLDEQAAPAAAAVDARLQVVRVLARTFALPVQFQDCLDLLPGRLVDERLVGSGVLGALKGDDSLVVGVFQHAVNVAFGDGLPGKPRRGDSRESAVVDSSAAVFSASRPRLRASFGFQ
nr:hypothetical protein [Rathayibacter sp. AY1F9]